MIYINDQLNDIDLDAALAQLSDQRREQALRFRHEQGRRECVAAYLLLCQALEKEYNITEKQTLATVPLLEPQNTELQHRLMAEAYIPSVCALEAL